VILGIDHVGIAVTDASAARETFVRLTEQGATEMETLPEQRVRVCFVPGAAAVRLELLEPLEEETAIGRFLARRGEGMHHVCYAVDDIHAEMARLAASGFTLVDEAPRRGHGGLVAFIHPRSVHGVLIELLQRDTAGSREELA
jgi:methylmalonyl-CoA epimerase